MKTLASVGLALSLVASVHAQVFRPRAGDHKHRDAPRVRVDVGHGYGGGYYGRHGYAPHHPNYHGGGHRGWYSHGGYYPSLGWGYYRPSYGYGYWPSYSYYGGYGDAYPYYDSYGYYGNGSAAASGLILGGVAGGIIGHNSGTFHHNGWRGAAWGAGLGWLLGTVVDANRRTHVPAAVQPAPAAQMPAQPAQTQPVTIINNYYNTATPMSGANTLFGR